MLELSTNLLAEIGGWAALKEARALVERGQVRDARREGAVIRAEVRGAEKTYEARITLADRVSQIETHCTCIESRRTGRVCAHALAAGLALLQPVKANDSQRGKSQGVARTTRCPGELAPARSQEIAANVRRWLTGEAPVGTPALELTILLPLQLAEALTAPTFRVILEARRDGQTQPFDAALRGLAGGFSVSEEDDGVLRTLESISGSAGGINAVPRDKVGIFLRALSGHPHVWLGKKQRIEVAASSERPTVFLKNRADGALELSISGNRRMPRDGATSGWHFDGARLTETPALPAGVSSGTRIIPREQIPDFLGGELSALERQFDLVFAPGFEEFVLETGRPVIEARLDGALSGLTLEFIAHYGDKAFPLSGAKATPGNDSASYFPHPQKPNRFWRRNAPAEQAAREEAESAGFALVRAGASAFSLTQENRVARFLANRLPRWREQWQVRFGPRLEATLREVDFTEPEYSLRPGSGEDWLSLDLKLSVGGKPAPLDAAEIQRWLQTGQSHMRTADRRVLLVPTEAWGEMREVLADASVEQEPAAGKIRVPRAQASFLAGALTAQGFHGKNPAANLPIPDVKVALDEKLAAQLRPYQLRGVEWLAGLAQQKLHGLLADDMGLGKTLQALAFCAWLKAIEPPGRPATATLVVCPTSLVTNWLREAARFTPRLRTLDLTGADRAKKFGEIDRHDLLVTSYAVLRRDVELYRAKEFSLVVLDEAQHIKNRGSQNAQSAKALCARRRLVLTGTPLENSVLDLWSLYDFLLPGYLGSAADFRERYETPLSRGPSPRAMARLRHRVRPYFLRRTKEEVLTDLPPKLDFPTLCELTGEQQEVYRAILVAGRREVFEHSGKAGKGRDRIAVLTTLLRLRQVCCHLEMLPQGETKRAWKEPSAKMERTFELIDEAIDGGHRVLLFSQFVRALHLLRDEARRRELRFCYLDGQTVERQAEVDRFQNDAAIPLFFISLKAGGTGLNLTGADTVIHFDPWWNPAVEEQATARAHRLGQSRRVQAYKLIAAGTVEEKIQALQARKRELFEASLGGDEVFVDKLTGDDLEELLAE